MAVAERALVLLLLLVVWAIFASPLLLGLYIVTRRLGVSRLRSRLLRASIALVFALVAAPTPTPIITIFVPQVVALIALLNPADAMAVFASELWLVMLASTTVTFAAAYALIARIVGSLDRVARERSASI